MVSLFLAMVLTAEAPTLAALDLEPQQVAPAVAKLVGTQLVQRLTLKGFHVVTQADLSAVLGVERQKQLLGCGEETSCLAEIGAAMNAKGVLLGSVGKLGETRLLNVKVVSPSGAQALAVCSAKANSDEALVAEAEKCADTIVAALLPAPLATVTPTVRVTSSTSGATRGRRTWALVPMIIGAATIVVSGILFGASWVQAAEVQRSTGPAFAVFAEAQGAAKLGNIGLVTLGIGAAIAVTGAVLFFTGPGPVQPVAFIAPDGATVGVRGAFP